MPSWLWYLIGGLIGWILFWYVLSAVVLSWFVQNVVRHGRQ